MKNELQQQIDYSFKKGKQVSGWGGKKGQIQPAPTGKQMLKELHDHTNEEKPGRLKD